MVPSDVVQFWFEDAWSDPAAAEARSQFWYGGGEALDDTIRERFEPTLRKAAAGTLRDWEKTPEGALATVVLLDQFSRHCHRGSPDAFAQDDAALAVAKRAITGGLDQALPPPGQVFLLHPFHHSESLAEQQHYVDAIDALVRSVPSAWSPFAESFVRYAAHHRDVIARFGRFPHRNEVLGRANTEAEDAYLARTGGAPVWQPPEP